MRKFGIYIAVTIMILFTSRNVVLANEELTDAYLIVEADQTELVQFMQKKGISIKKAYTSFSVISADLTDSEITLIRSNFPGSSIHSNRIYDKSKDSERPSMKAVRATGELTTPYSGAGVKVAVLDSGIDTEHRDLNIKGGFCSLRYECAPGIPYDDDNGHGTHVAGIIAALKNDTGIVGIAPNVDLYSIKALNAFGVGTTNSLIDGIEWAIKNKMDIVNLSITTEADDIALKTALDAAYSKGILLVGSAGNNGELTNKSVMYPAKYSSVIAVSAVRADLKKLKESAVGEEVEITAPGESILSTYPIKLDFADFKVDGYTHLSGTSMATPHVTGILALYKERFPTKSNAELRTLINDNAKDLGAPGKDPVFGYGLVQYVAELAGTATIDVKNEVGQAILTSKSNEIIKLETSGKQVLLVNGQWTLYGVGGKKVFLVTTQDASGKKTVEQQYVTFKTPTFPDVTNNQRFAGPIGFMSNKNQINGFNDGTFRPHATITREEAAVLIGRALDFSSAPSATRFQDVSASSFASGYIKAAVDAKIISGFSDGTFRPGSYVTRAEMAILISKGFELNGKNNAEFKDVSHSMAAYQAIKSLIASGVTTGYGDNTFKPYDLMTRADFTVFLARAQNDFFK
ncbi:S8 family serine peptidase [Sporosarcina sp. BP05]|uniref:S8 family peptidase n=1 Tax=Sporosarcina sp. BP05 TaxID=2758726 RepID=UPI001647C531|nr:S8 family serine peptidase [Sporosarcina sp. BP05]